MISWAVDITRKDAKQWRTFNYNKGRYDDIRQELMKVKWSEYLHGDTENRRQQFKHVIYTVQTKYIPVITTKKQKSKKAIWINRKATKAVAKKEESIRNIKTSTTQQSGHKTKKQRRNCIVLEGN